MQDKVIEELKNNQRHHENQEATMVTMYILICNFVFNFVFTCVTQNLFLCQGNCARSDHNNSQNQAVLSKRKVFALFSMFSPNLVFWL